MTRWLVTGARGQLGSDLLRVLDGADVVDEVVGLGRADLDVTDATAVRDAVAGFEIVLNAAAYTKVDDAESDVDGAVLGNEVGPRVLAEACRDVGALFVHVSTDYVFDGQGTEPYAEDAPTAPRSVYGRTKLAGEQAVLASGARAYVVRTAWVYGETGGNFVKTMARLERSHDTVSVVDDQRGSPTWSRDLARGLVELANSSAPYGIYHCTNAGDTTWFGFTQAIFEELGADPSRVKPTTTDAFPRPAPRPAYSVLGSSAWQKAGLTPMRHWRDALHEAFATAGAAFTNP